MGYWKRRRSGPRHNMNTRTASARERGSVRCRRRRRRVGYLLLWVATASLCGWGLAAAYRETQPLVADWLEVREITVTGLSRLTREDVIKRLALPGSVTQFSVRARELVNRLTGHPWIKAARVERRLPHGLSVHITERRPAVALRSPLLSLLLDEDGNVLSAASPLEMQDMPILLGVDPNRLLQGDAQARQATQAGIRLAGLLQDSFEDQPEIDVSIPGEVVAYAARRRFQFGAMSLDEQWNRYRAVEGALGASAPARADGEACRPNHLPEGGRPAASGCPEIDLRYQDKVIVRERG